LIITTYLAKPWDDGVEVPDYFNITLAWLLTILVLIYYFFLDVTFTGVLTVVFIIFNIIAKLVSNNMPTETGLIVFLVCFIVGWAFQIIGHIFEKKRP
jgi:uncharacterized membrane protein YGL010W